MRDTLSPRETQIVTLAAKGKTYKEIATVIGIDYETVNSHWKSIRLKLSTENTAHSIAISILRGFISL